MEVWRNNFFFTLCFPCINQNCHFIEIKYYIHKTNFSPSTSKFLCSCQREIFASKSIYNNLQCCVPYPRVVHWILFHWFSVNNQDWKKCLQISMGKESTQYLCFSNLNCFSHKNIKKQKFLNPNWFSLSLNWLLVLKILQFNFLSWKKLNTFLALKEFKFHWFVKLLGWFNYILTCT